MRLCLRIFHTNIYIFVCVSASIACKSTLELCFLVDTVSDSRPKASISHLLYASANVRQISRVNQTPHKKNLLITSYALVWIRFATEWWTPNFLRVRYSGIIIIAASSRVERDENRLGRKWFLTKMLCYLVYTLWKI